MEVVARRLVRYDESDVRSTVLWATATRHADCLAAAQVILLEAVERIPHSAALHYKLAAIEAQLGEIETPRLASSTRSPWRRRCGSARWRIRTWSRFGMRSASNHRQ